MKLAEPTAGVQSKVVLPSIALSGIVFEPGQDIDALLSAVAESLTHSGWFVSGLIQEEAFRTPGSCCPATFVRHLADGTRTKISFDRGENSSGCRLDAHALTEAAGSVEAWLNGGAQVLIINRFGQSESDGGGLRGTIERGIELGLPVIVGVRQTYAAQWGEFHGGLATSLAFDKSKILNWALEKLEDGATTTLGLTSK